MSDNVNSTYCERKHFCIRRDLYGCISYTKRRESIIVEKCRRAHKTKLCKDAKSEIQDLILAEISTEP